MPDHATAPIPVRLRGYDGGLDCLPSSMKLMIARDDFVDLIAVGVFLEYYEMLQQF